MGCSIAQYVNCARGSATPVARYQSTRHTLKPKYGLSIGVAVFVPTEFGYIN
jgi:hypothetical protein